MVSPQNPPEPSLLKATTLAESDVGAFEWNAEHNSDLLTITNGGKTIAWEPRGDRKDKYELAWVPASTRAHLHSSVFRWDFVVEEMSGAQIGIGFMLLWDLGPDWGFYGYLGASTTAWAYDPSTGDVVCATQSIHGGLPTFEDGRSGVVSVLLNLPREGAGTGRFIVADVETPTVDLPESSIVLPAACFLKKGQRVTLDGFRRE